MGHTDAISHCDYLGCKSTWNLGTGSFDELANARSDLPGPGVVGALGEASYRSLQIEREDRLYLSAPLEAKRRSTVLTLGRYGDRSAGGIERIGTPWPGKKVRMSMEVGVLARGLKHM